MVRSLGLTAYRAMARRGDAAVVEPTAVRPFGEVVWLHAPETESLLAVQDLAKRLCSQRPATHVLITTLQEVTPTSSSKYIIFAPTPDEHPSAVTAFLDYWQPNLCLWCWGGLRPNLILETARHRCQMLLIDADTSGFDGRRERWLPDVARSLLPLFRHVLVRSDAAAKRLKQLGALEGSLEVISPLQAGGTALHCEDQDTADFGAAVVGRSIWFANAAQPEELAIIFAAHRLALRLSHRLLLILRPCVGLPATTVLACADEEGFRVLNWDSGTYPNESTQVLIADDPRDVGLFYRVAPVSFLGGTLSAGHDSPDPFEAAALGSAILYGPKVGQFLPFYSRLASAGAARIVNDAAALGSAVSRLVAPDHAASMAHAGWDVISQGAAATDRVIDLAQDALDAALEDA